MKYLFVSLAILAVWVGTILIVAFLKNTNILLPLVALAMSLVLFLIGFAKK